MKKGKSGSNPGRLLLLIPLLLVVAVAVNWPDISAIARGEKTLKGVIMGRTTNASAAMEGWKLPEDMGAEDAKVTVEIFLHQGDACHVDFLYLGQSLGTVEPERLRVDFVDTGSEAGRKRFSELSVGCEQGMAINGKTKFKLPPRKPKPGAATDAGQAATQTNMRGSAPTEQEPGKERTLYLTLDGGWDMADLHHMLNGELEAAYDGKGLKMTPEEFETHVTAKREEFRTKLEEEMKARKEAAKDEG
ncbi:MAG: hypothetical protein HPY44_11645 [Armatimonadetes bacterium]|nr:hypothetical protein [Armatimonadota bacterium]